MQITLTFNDDDKSKVAKAIRQLLLDEVIDIQTYVTMLNQLAGPRFYSLGDLEVSLGLPGRYSPPTAANGDDAYNEKVILESKILSYYNNEAQHGNSPKIHTIKYCRELTKMGLREAKEYVEGICGC